MRWMAVIVFLLSLTLSGALAAKEPDEQSWENLKQLRVGQKIQVVRTDFRSHRGTFLGFSEEAVSLSTPTGDIGIQRQNVLRVSIRERSRRGRNAVIGAAIGAAVGLAVGVAYCHGDCDLARGIA